MGLGAVAVQHRSAALVLSHAAQLVVEVAAGLILLLYGSAFVIQRVVAQILITESRIIQRTVVALAAQVLTGKVRILAVD